MSSKDEEVCIVGAGLAGCLMACFLAKRSYHVKVFELRPDRRKQSVAAGRSINLSLSDRGVVALKAAGIFDQVEPHLVKMPGRMIHPLNGDAFYQSYGRKPNELHYSLSRGGLNDILLSAAESSADVSIQFSQKCVDLDWEASKLSFEDQESSRVSSLNFSHVIACDGAPSAVRAAFHKLPKFECRAEELGASYKELCIPPDPNGKYRLEKEALHIWPRGQFMLIALPNSDGSFTVTLFLPNTGEWSFESLKSEPRLEEFFQKFFPDCIELIPDFKKDFFANPTGHLATIRSFPWHFGDKALMLGDAAHAVVPFHGQGMNCSFEDCLELDRCLEEFSGDWLQAFAETEKRRKPNADAIAQMAIENYTEMRDEVRDPKFHLRKRLEWALEEKFPDRFLSRYSMVMFYHQYSYSEALERGKIQTEILQKLTDDIDDISKVDWTQAQSLVANRLSTL